MEERRDCGEEGIGGGGEVMIPSLIRVFIAVIARSCKAFARGATKQSLRTISNIIFAKIASGDCFVAPHALFPTAPRNDGEEGSTHTSFRYQFYPLYSYKYSNDNVTL